MLTDRRTDGRIDTETNMTKLIVTFQNFADAPKNHSVNTDLYNSAISYMLRGSQACKASDGSHCVCPTLPCTTESLSVSLNYTTYFRKPSGEPAVFLLL
jgi:hypothetical protein